MTGSPKLFAMLVAVALCGCGAVTGADSGTGKTQLGMPSVQAAPVNGGASAAQAPSGAQEASLRNAALTYTAMSDPQSSSYKIGPLDVLEITVFKVPDLNKTLQVSEAGTINFPLLGDVDVRGKTARDVEQLLTARLGAKYLQNPQIAVFIKEHKSQRVTIEGAVKKPGIIPMAGGLTLLQAVAQAQGLADTAESSAAVFRTSGGKRFAVKYDISKIREGKADDPQLQSGDVVVIPTSDVKEGLNMAIKLLPLAYLIPVL